MKLTNISKGNPHIFNPAPGDFYQRPVRKCSLPIAGIFIIFVISYLIGMTIYIAIF